MGFPPAPSLLARAGRLVVLAILIGIGASHVVFAIRDWPLGDMDVYLAAARRLRDGEALYIAGDAVNSFWYAPWYAVLWVPLTYLSREIVAVAWSGVLIASTIGVSAMLARSGRWGVITALLVGPPLFAVSAGGNVQPVIVLLLLWGFNRRLGPVTVAVAASLKFTPVLLAFAYAAKGQWWRAMFAIVLTAAAVLSGEAMGLLHADFRWDAAPALLGISPVLYIVVVVIVIVATFKVANRYALLSAATAAVLALPRLFVYDVTLLAVGAAKDDELEQRQPPAFTLTHPGRRGRHGRR